MKSVLFGIMLISACFGGEVNVGDRNRVLMIDQDNEINIPNVLATTAMMSSNKVAAAIASAKAESARRASNDASNMVDNVVAQIASNELVVYREGFLDSFSSDIGLPPGTKCRVIKMTPLNESIDPGLDMWEFEYAVTSEASGIVPEIMVADTLETPDGSSDSWKNFMPTVGTVSSPQAVNKTYTDQDGTFYPFVYKVRFTTKKNDVSSFFIVYLSGDDTGSGAVLDIVGGIQGGKTAEIVWGGWQMSFKGGLLIDVKEYK